MSDMVSGADEIERRSGTVPPPWWCFLPAGALVGTGLLTAYAVIKSKRLADLLDALSDESLNPSQRLRAIFGSWRRSQ